VTPTLAILIPVLDRPQRVEPLIESVNACTPEANLLFLCSPGDAAEIEAVKASGANHVVVPWPCGPGDFARKQNYGFAQTEEEWVFCGADDLVFHHGWFESCMATHHRSRACVIGTVDKGNWRTVSGQHSTHFLVHRDYLECGTIDEPGKIFNESYDHQWTDDECVQTAMWRGTYAHAHTAIVEHQHPHWGTATMDQTYEKATRATAQDQALYESRKHLWGKVR